MKTSELTDAALDWAVARARGLRPSLFIFQQTGFLAKEHHYSTNPTYGHPILEQERLDLSHLGDGTYAASKYIHKFHARAYEQMGPTMLIAGLRCFVESELGDEVDIPKELM